MRAKIAIAAGGIFFDFISLTDVIVGSGELEVLEEGRF